MSVDCDAKRDDVGGDESARDLERLLLLSDTCWDASHLQSSHRGSTGPRCDKRSDSLHTRVSSEETKEAEHHSLKRRRWEERRRGGEGTQWSEWNQHHGESPRYTLLPRRRSIYILQNKKLSAAHSGLREGALVAADQSERRYSVCSSWFRLFLLAPFRGSTLWDASQTKWFISNTITPINTDYMLNIRRNVVNLLPENYIGYLRTFNIFFYIDIHQQTL